MKAGKDWQWLKVFAGLLFFGAAVLLYLYGPDTKNTRVLVVLLFFLGLFYPLSALAFRWLLKKFDGS